MFYIDVISCNSLNLPVTQSIDIGSHHHAPLCQTVTCCPLSNSLPVCDPCFTNLMRIRKNAKISTFVTKVYLGAINTAILYNLY
jgi:hypothetical protein